VPQNDAVAYGEVDPAGGHRDHRSEAEHGDDRFVRYDRPEIQKGREGVWQKDGEQQDQRRREDDKSVDRRQSQQSGACGQTFQFRLGRFERIGVQ